MIAAADAIIFVAPEIERCAPMRAEFTDEARPSLGVAEGKQLFAQYLHADRRTIGFRNFAAKEDGYPETAQECAGGRARIGPHQRLHHVDRKSKRLNSSH